MLAVAAAVAAWGLIDAYAIDLDWWRHNGTVGYFRDQLRFHYGAGLSHLPENFVYNNGNEQELTRRLVSTFLSPLGTAFLASSRSCSRRERGSRFRSPRSQRPACSGRTPAPRCSGSPSASSFSPPSAPRLAARRSRRDLAVGLAFLAVFPDIGPRAHFTPRELAYQRAQAHKNGPTRLEPSAESHLSQLRDGIQTVAEHPQGYGLGNAGEVAFREGVPLKAGESNYTELGVETGLLGALLFIAWNLALLAALVRARQAALAAMLAAALVMAIQTDAYGIPWIAYCVWWLAASGLDRMSIDPRVDIGHVHLKVSDIDRALAFYDGVLGFEVMLSACGTRRRSSPPAATTTTSG